MLNPALLAPFVSKIENVQELMETASALADDVNRATAGVTEATQGA